MGRREGYEKETGRKERKASAMAQAVAQTKAETKARAKAEAEAKAAAEAAQRARQEQEWTLILSQLSAKGVPNADKSGGSDPYVRFTLLNGSAETIETGRTQPQYNTTDPVWPHNVSLLMPSGSEAALNKLSLIHI